MVGFERGLGVARDRDCLLGFPNLQLRSFAPLGRCRRLLSSRIQGDLGLLVGSFLPFQPQLLLLRGGLFGSRDIYFATERLEFQAARLDPRRAVGALPDPLLGSGQCGFAPVLQLFETSADRLEAFETLAEDLNVQQRLEVAQRFPALGVERPGQPPLFHPQQLGEQFRKSFAVPKAEQPAEVIRHRLVPFGLGAAVLGENHFGPALVLGSQPAFQPILPAFPVEFDLNFTRFFARPQQVGGGVELFLVHRRGQKQRIAQALDQGGLAVAVFPGNPVDAGFETNGHAVAVGPFSVGLDILEAERTNDHAPTGSGAEAGTIGTAGSGAGVAAGFSWVASRILSINGLSWMSSVRCSTGRLARMPSFNSKNRRAMVSCSPSSPHKCSSCTRVRMAARSISSRDNSGRSAAVPAAASPRLMPVASSETALTLAARSSAWPAMRKSRAIRPRLILPTNR